jgi:hypothetical protein
MPSNGTESREKALCLFCGLEAPHLLFPQPRGLVRIFRTIVQPFVLTVLHAKQYLAFRRTITSELIRDDDARDLLESFQQFAEKSFRRVCVAPALNKDIKHIPILIHRSPEIVFLGYCQLGMELNSVLE